MDAPLILIVDDEPAIRETLELALADEGYRVESAADGSEGLAIAGRTHFDLVLSDVMMPRMGGVELVAQLRARGDAVPVVLMSANYSSVDLPLVRFLAKPFDLDDLTAAVRQELSEGRRRS